MINLIKQVQVIIYLLIALVIVEFIVICFSFAPAGHDRYQNFYNIVNSIAPVITIPLLFFTFRNQQQQLSTLQKQVIKVEDSQRCEQIEKRFFLFLGIHRDNVATMTYEDKILGKGLFVKTVDNFRKIHNALDKYLNLSWSEGLLVRKPGHLEKIEITYKIIFYGCTGAHAEAILKESLSHLDNLMKDRRKKFTIFLISLCKDLKITEKGLQSDLGNYYRHFFHTVTYIHDQKSLSEKEKKFYLKRLRGQLSNYEIALLFVNSFSIGRRWRHYDPNDELTCNGIDLIETYQMTKNIPPGFLSGLNLEQYFPGLVYEGRVKSDRPTRIRREDTRYNPEIAQRIRDEKNNKSND